MLHSVMPMNTPQEPFTSRLGDPNVLLEGDIIALINRIGWSPYYATLHAYRDYDITAVWCTIEIGRRLRQVAQANDRTASKYDWMGIGESGMTPFYYAFRLDSFAMHFKLRWGETCTMKNAKLLAKLLPNKVDRMTTSAKLSSSD